MYISGVVSFLLWYSTGYFPYIYIYDFVDIDSGLVFLKGPSLGARVHIYIYTRCSKGGAKAPPISRDVPSLRRSAVPKFRCLDIPAVRPKTPELKPETPELKPETSELKPETPKAKARDPRAKARHPQS